ncbi:MAG: DUF1844 domain-containing protein [Phycisphaerae bacterium]|nr:DUF1844 domain-containing protein [Phycisphaerae bacterium]
MADDAPKLQIDSDWKKQAQEEKEKLAKQVDKPAAEAGAAAAGGAVGPEGLPPASFAELLEMLGSQALFFLGQIADPQTGKAVLSPPLAKHYIDLIGILEEKTKGNLTPEEKGHLDQLLYEARMIYVQVGSAGVGAAGRGPRPARPGQPPKPAK